VGTAQEAALPLISLVLIAESYLLHRFFDDCNATSESSWSVSAGDNRVAGPVRVTTTVAPPPKKREAQRGKKETAPDKGAQPPQKSTPPLPETAPTPKSAPAVGKEAARGGQAKEMSEIERMLLEKWGM
jgi:hypothetical protein